MKSIIQQINESLVADLNNPKKGNEVIFYNLKTKKSTLLKINKVEKVRSTDEIILYFVDNDEVESIGYTKTDEETNNVIIDIGYDKNGDEIKFILATNKESIERLLELAKQLNIKY